MLKIMISLTVDERFVLLPLVVWFSTSALLSMRTTTLFFGTFTERRELL